MREEVGKDAAKRTERIKIWAFLIRGLFLFLFFIYVSTIVTRE